MDAHTKTILFLGPTGSGKGVQSKLLSDKLGYPVFSTGGRYRELRVGEGDLAKRIREQYDGGHLMPAWFSTFLFEEAFLYKPLAEGIICEGVGRTLFEVQNFHDVMEWLRRPYIVFCLNISEEESMKRQLLRTSQEVRPESDSEEKIRTRFAEFKKHTSSAIAFLREKGKVIDMEGERTIEEIHKDVCGHLGVSV